MTKKAKDDQPALWPLHDDNADGKKKFAPGSLRPPLPFGRLSLVENSVGSATITIDHVTAPDLDSRLSKLGGRSELAPAVSAIKKIAAERKIQGMDYLADWELRARLAEAELVGLFLDACALPEKASSARSSFAKRGKHYNEHEYGLVRDCCDKWIAGGMMESRATMLKGLEALKALQQIRPKTIEGWWDARKVELVGKRRK